jgi:hypothetical protein
MQRLMVKCIRLKLAQDFSQGVSLIKHKLFDENSDSMDSILPTIGHCKSSKVVNAINTTDYILSNM